MATWALPNQFPPALLRVAGLNDSRHQGDHNSSSVSSSPTCVAAEAWHAWRVCKLM